MPQESLTLAIDVEQISKTYGSTKALDNVTFQVPIGTSRALIGRNGAGKSTLIGALTGLVVPEAGNVTLRGAQSGAPERAGGNSLACVFQQSTLVDDMTAAENIRIGQYPKRRGRVHWPEVRESALRLLDDWGFGHIVDRRVEELEPLERKVVEICRAMSRGPRILLLDEPTAGLDEAACTRLYAKLNDARARGVTIVYVSHHLEEIFEVCDSITIMRDGRDVLTRPTAGLSIPEIVEVMVGERASKQHSKLESHRVDLSDAPPAVILEDVSFDTTVEHVELTIRKGECYGLTGLEGAGHIGVAKLIAGLVGPTSGTVRLSDGPVPTGDIASSIRAGIGFVPEDRHASGFVPGMSVEENATLSILKSLRTPLGTIDASRRAQSYRQQSDAWSIKASSPRQNTEELSGGNQQKVVLARALASDPSVLVLINPTAGVDVAAKESIYATILRLQREGRTVVICSTDDADLAICNRVGVMFKGRLNGNLTLGWAEHELVAALHGANPEPQTIS